MEKKINDGGRQSQEMQNKKGEIEGISQNYEDNWDFIRKIETAKGNEKKFRWKKKLKLRESVGKDILKFWVTSFVLCAYIYIYIYVCVRERERESMCVHVCVCAHTYMRVGIFWVILKYMIIYEEVARTWV